MLEEEFFNKYKVNKDKLINFGFKKEKDYYIYEEKFLDTFLAYIKIEKNKVEGKVIDLDFNEEYTLFRVKNINDSYANKVKEEYIKILKKVRNNCFTEMPFRGNQANRINILIKEKYKNNVEFPWKDENNKDSGIYRDSKTRKWYALIQYVESSKLDSNKTGKKEYINLKINSSKYNKDGIYPAYHMNHEKWISVVLDDTLKDSFIMELIEESHENILGKEVHSWIVPSTSGWTGWSVENYFENGIVTWNESTNVHVGDTVYIYVSAPYSCIMYKCEITQAHMPGFYHYKHSMKLKVIEKYERGKFSFKLMNDFGVKAVRGPRSIPKELEDYISKVSVK